MSAGGLINFTVSQRRWFEGDSFTGGATRSHRASKSVAMKAPTLLLKGCVTTCPSLVCTRASLAPLLALKATSLAPLPISNHILRSLPANRAAALSLFAQESAEFKEGLLFLRRKICCFLRVGFQIVEFLRSKWTVLQ